MDTRLSEAVQTGDVDDLQQLINSEPLILCNVALTCTDTPLHIACLAGHVSIVKLLLRSRADFAQELNQDGFSPLHMAAAAGHVDIVRELLKVDPSLCLLKGKGNRLPLHCATIKGRVPVVKDLLLSAGPATVAVMTSRGETTLHLAVKNNQFEIFCVLIEHVMRQNMFDVLNKKDGQGNSILHIAAVKRQLEVIDLLLKQNSATNSVLEVNSMNELGFTPLDAFLLLPSEAGDREIEDIIRQAGGIKAKDIGGVPTNHNQHHTSYTRRPMPPERSLPLRLLDIFKYNMETDSPNDVRNVLLVVAILIATATFQAGTSLAGLMKEVTDDPVTMTRCCFFAVFSFFNSLGIFTSLHMIYVLTNGFPMQAELFVCLIAVAVTHTASFIAQLSAILFHQVFAMIVMGLAFLIVIIAVLARHIPRKKLRCDGSGDFQHLIQHL